VYLPSVKASRGAHRSVPVDLYLYSAAAVSYVVLGLYNRWLLDWIIGPLWLVAWLQVVPALGRRLLRRPAVPPAGSARPTGPPA